MPREVGKRKFDRSFKQHLVNASNELFLHEQRCAEYNRPFTHSMSQAHALVRKELERLREEEERLDAEGVHGIDVQQQQPAAGRDLEPAG